MPRPKQRIKNEDNGANSHFVIEPSNAHQQVALESINKNSITFLTGPAGTGKTHLAVLSGLQSTIGYVKYHKVVFTRPCVEAYGEKLGFLPGDYNEKISPYMIPIMDIITKYMTQESIESLVKKERIVTLPLAYHRGVTFEKAFVILDEAQNTLPEQMLMCLTRLGKNSKMIITGDLDQSDIEGKNGLSDAMERLKDIKGIGMIKMPAESIVRHSLVEAINSRYRDN